LNKYNKYEKELFSKVNDTSLEIKKGGQKEFLAIPMSSSKNISTDYNIHNLNGIQKKIDNLRLCEKNKLPKEKNYCITEKNLKLIEMAIGDKDSDIETLKSMLILAKKDLDHFGLRDNQLYCIIDEQNDEKANLKDNIDDLLNENKILKQTLEEYVDQYNKIIIVQKKFENTINIIIDLLETNTFNKLLDKDGKDTLPPLLNESLKNLKTSIDKDQIKNYASIFRINENQINNIEKKVTNDLTNNLNINMILRQKSLKSPVSNMTCDTSYPNTISIDKLNKDLKRKSYIEQLEDKLKSISSSNLEYKLTIIDLENFIHKLNPILEKSKDVNLSEAAKDLIAMNKKVINLNKTINKLEMENNYFRIALYNNNNNNNDDLINKNINNKYRAHEQQNGKSHKYIFENMSNAVKDLNEKQNEIDNLNNLLKEKDDYVEELSKKIEDLSNQIKNIKNNKVNYII